MKCLVPNYYFGFFCIADRCRHSCCIGWEIDIDEQTYAAYQTISGDWGKRFREHIQANPAPSFRLDEHERCPFLNSNGLCDIILAFGEQALCQICTDHPRFRNFFSGRIEMGLGLCCEEAARLILCQKEPFSLMTLEEDGGADEVDSEETLFFQWRDDLIEFVQTSAFPLRIRAEKLLALQPFSLADWRPFLLKLEQMDHSWAILLNRTALSDDADLDKWDQTFEKLLIYLLWRHLSVGFENDDVSGRLAFALWAWQLIRTLFSCSASQTQQELIEICRLFSCEIEYSDENADAIIEELRRRNFYAPAANIPF